MTVRLDEVNQIADAYEAAVRANAEIEGRDLDHEALAAIIGAARCVAYPKKVVVDFVLAAQQDRVKP